MTSEKLEETTFTNKIYRFSICLLYSVFTLAILIHFLELLISEFYSLLEITPNLCSSIAVICYPLIILFLNIYYNIYIKNNDNKNTVQKNFLLNTCLFNTIITAVIFTTTIFIILIEDIKEINGLEYIILLFLTSVTSVVLSITFNRIRITKPDPDIKPLSILEESHKHIFLINCAICISILTYRICKNGKNILNLSEFYSYEMFYRCFLFAVLSLIFLTANHFINPLRSVK